MLFKKSIYSSNSLVIIKKIITFYTLLKIILHLIDQITKYHYRFPNIFNKISQILHILFKDIKHTFSVDDIYEIFASNKLVILFIIEEKLIDDIYDFIHEIINSNDFNDDLFQFFLPEIKQHINDNDFKKDLTEDQINQCNTKKILKDFEEKRRIGENDEY